MPVHPFDAPRGRVATLSIDSAALRGNLLGDPTRRAVAVYLPAGYDDSGDDYPLLVALAGFTGSGPKHLAWRAFAFPDCFTSLGGNQYVNSLALGNWEDFLLDEMVPRVESAFRVRRGARHRAVLGKSSGGYGALVQGLRHGDRWGAVACHSGDMGFDLVYRRDFPRLCDELARHGRDVSRFLEHVRSAVKVKSGEMCALMMLAMAATYDPDPGAPLGIHLPLDLETARVDEAAWRRWLAHDPLVLIESEECRRSVRALAALYLDCGSRDQYYLHYGARAFVARLKELDVPHRYEEFDDDHSGVDYRMDVSLPLLYEAVR
jgi:hypothetical protein